MNPSISVVIPAYNEVSRLDGTLRTVLSYLNREYESPELILVDDGSRDGTADLAERLFSKTGNVHARVISNQVNRGKGHAVRTGLLSARAPIALFSDADLSTPITEMPKLIRLIQNGSYDLAFGSRALDRSLIGARQPWRREQGGRVFNLLVRSLTGLPFWDTQCGFKAFRMSTCRPVIEAAVVDRFAFDVELLCIARAAGLNLKEVAVRWDHYDGSKVNFLRDSVRMFGEVRAIRQRGRGVRPEPETAADRQHPRESICVEDTPK